MQDVVIWKPTLLTLINYYQLTIPSLAHTSRLQVNTVRAIAIRGMPVQRAVAEQLLEGLSRMVKVRYTLANVSISIGGWDDPA